MAPLAMNPLTSTPHHSVRHCRRTRRYGAPCPLPAFAGMTDTLQLNSPLGLLPTHVGMTRETPLIRWRLPVTSPHTWGRGVEGAS